MHCYELLSCIFEVSSETTLSEFVWIETVRTFREGLPGVAKNSTDKCWWMIRISTLEPRINALDECPRWHNPILQKSGTLFCGTTKKRFKDQIDNRNKTGTRSLPKRDQLYLFDFMKGKFKQMLENDKFEIWFITSNTKLDFLGWRCQLR